MIVFAPAGFFLLVFACGFLSDRRLVRNGVHLFLALLFLALGLLYGLASVSSTSALVLVSVLWLLLVLLPFAPAVFLIANGMTMLRREGGSPANLLSLTAGAGILLFVALKALADRTRWEPLGTAVNAAGFVLGYVSLLFACFLLHSFVYGRIRHRRAVDFVVLLGCGLIEGSRAPPLPAGLILVEDRSRTTQENLRFGKALMRAREPDHRALVVTSDFHVMRAAQIARREKVEAQVVGVRTARCFWPSATIREFVAVVLSHRVLNLGACALLAVIGSLRPY
ncbi:ElyC/SanA/YdcF family protein [Streptomyces niveiscabiei]|uniref:YdcF family protein n=1 Tax=Streptomyces niveiscabiei TaxID=164115 RepID=UPI0029A8FFED|nr:ElyC/SanA/YdcF family protein [Streptomyces niveiscabiei]MDX3382322.1 ElyC/SanA/YdcF family protein [Streptomyces niveiscabiei]